jgi:hypothetical protein
MKLIMLRMVTAAKSVFWCFRKRWNGLKAIVIPQLMASLIGVVVRCGLDTRS